MSVSIKLSTTKNYAMGYIALIGWIALFLYAYSKRKTVMLKI